MSLSHGHRVMGKISNVLILSPTTGTSCPSQRLVPLAFPLESPKLTGEVAAEDGPLKQKLHGVGDQGGENLKCCGQKILHIN